MWQKIKCWLNHPAINRLCFKYRWLGKTLCKLNINHSYRLTNVSLQPLKLDAECIYCGKKVTGEIIHE